MSKEICISSTPHETRLAILKTINSQRSITSARTNTPSRVPFTKAASPASFPECSRHLSIWAWSATRFFTSPIFWKSRKTPPTSSVSGGRRGGARRGAGRRAAAEIARGGRRACEASRARRRAAAAEAQREPAAEASAPASEFAGWHAPLARSPWPPQGWSSRQQGDDRSDQASRASGSSAEAPSR